MTRIHEIRPDIDDGIDRKALAQLRARFLTINQTRLARANDALSSRQQLVLSLLPLLLHVNHPLLPGYVLATTPAGLSGYEPDDLTLANVQRLARSFVYRSRRGHERPPLHGLFLMGSLGTLAQAEQSDMDLWLCHDPAMGTEALGELQKKCTQLETWAATQGAEVHLFLVNPKHFADGTRQARLSGEDCGSSQHYLLLDEFYRTAIWLAGRTPLWWLVPVYAEHEYAAYTHTLLAKRFAREEDVLDLGSIAELPPSEFVGAGLWQLYKGIESPYKSALKLLLIEVYASEHPNVECLALRFKRAVYEGHMDLDELDPYILLYRRLEDYLLERGDRERLELVRKCLYLKVNKHLSRPPARGRQKSWQRMVMERLTQKWGWSTPQLTLLDSRSQWKIRQVLGERRVLVNELTYSYRFLSQFARSAQVSSTLNNQDLNILGRRLYAAFERKASKIERINPGIAPDLGEASITLAQRPTPDTDAPQWTVYSGSLTASELSDYAPLKRSHSLIELLAWGHLNEVIDASTRLSLHPGSSALTEFELVNILGAIRKSFPLPLKTVGNQALLDSAVPVRVLLLVNVGVDPLQQHSQKNLHMTTERTDALGYSGSKGNLILTLDQLSLNSWNELSVSCHEGEDALFDCLSELLNQIPLSAPAPTIEVRCFCHNRAQPIAARVEEVLGALMAQRRDSQPSRYLLQLRDAYRLLHLRDGHMHFESLADQPALIRTLAQPLPAYSPLRLDRHALRDNDLALILPQGQPGTIQVFYRLMGPGAEAQISVLDEHNTLWQRRQPYRDEQSLLMPLQRFIQAMLYRREAVLPLDLPVAPTLEILCYRVLPDGPARAQRIEPRRPYQSPVNHPFYDVQAIIQPGDNGTEQVTLYCNHREFSELEYGQRLYRSVAKHILEQRTGDEHYPVYITDLDVSALKPGSAAQTTLYLIYKTQLEAALNEALHQGGSNR